MLGNIRGSSARGAAGTTSERFFQEIAVVLRMPQQYSVAVIPAISVPPLSCMPCCIRKNGSLCVNGTTEELNRIKLSWTTRASSADSATTRSTCDMTWEFLLVRPLRLPLTRGGGDKHTPRKGFPSSGSSIMALWHLAFERPFRARRKP